MRLSDLLLLIPLILVVGMLLRRVVRDRRLRHWLADWAEEQGWQLVRFRRCWVSRGPFAGRISRGRTVCRVTIQTDTGERRQGWVCGRPATLARADRPDVEWDGQVRPAWTFCAQLCRDERSVEVDVAAVAAAILSAFPGSSRDQDPLDQRARKAQRRLQAAGLDVALDILRDSLAETVSHDGEAVRLLIRIEPDAVLEAVIRPRSVLLCGSQDPLLTRPAFRRLLDLLASRGYQWSRLRNLQKRGQESYPEGGP